MKWLNIASLLFTAIVVSANPVESEVHEFQRRDAPQGIDVSSHQGDIDWGAVKGRGVSFAYIKATEGTGKLMSVCYRKIPAHRMLCRLSKPLFQLAVHRCHQRWFDSRLVPLCSPK